MTTSRLALMVEISTPISELLMVFPNAGSVDFKRFILRRNTCFQAGKIGSPDTTKRKIKVVLDMMIKGTST